MFTQKVSLTRMKHSDSFLIQATEKDTPVTGAEQHSDREQLDSGLNGVRSALPGTELEAYILSHSLVDP